MIRYATQLATVEKTEIRILSALFELLHTKPYADITTDELTRAAPVSKPTFYKRIGTLDHCLLQLHERCVPQLSEFLDTLQLGATISCDEQAVFEAVAGTFDAYVKMNSELLLPFFQVFGAKVEGLNATLAYTRLLADTLARLLSGVTAKEPPDVFMAAQVITNLTVGYALGSWSGLPNDFVRRRASVARIARYAGLGAGTP